jgi:hypothetical protein
VFWRQGPAIFIEKEPFMPSPQEKSLLISEMNLRLLVGYLGIALPIILVVFADFVFQPSISEYYYTPARDVFVGVLCAVGVFLSCYKGYDITDKTLSLVAGLTAILVGLVPAAVQGATGWEDIRGNFHLAFAALFLGCLAWLSLFQFTKTDSPNNMTDRKVKRNWVYRACGCVMAACLAVIFLYKLPLTKDLMAFLQGINPVYSFESIAVIAFGVSWLIKGEGLLGDKKTDAAGQVPKT